MQHQIDEFSVSDLRHTLSEGWRVVRDRRWHFIFPFAVVSSLALVGSLLIERNYRGTTIIKRENDPVLASMIGKSWTEPYAEIRQRMSVELADVEEVEKILTELDLPAGLERFDSGELTPQSREARARMAAEVSRGLGTRSLESSTNRDIVAIDLTLKNPTHLTSILSAVRDHYVVRARKKTSEVLTNVETFFQVESERCRTQLSDIRRKLLEYQLEYPGIDPDEGDPAQSEQSAVTVETLQLEREMADLVGKRRRIDSAIESGCMPGEGDGADSGLPAARTPNPDYIALRSEVEKLRGQITEAKTIRLMTDQHPVIERLNQALISKSAELERTPRDISSAATMVSGQTAAERLVAQAAEIDARTATVRARLEDLRGKRASIDQRRLLAVDHREAYLKLKTKAERINAELNTWQQNIGPIRHILTVEDKNRGIHFTTVQDAAAAEKPVSPAANMVIGICLAIGAIVGAAVALLGELLDRSFRTVKQLQSSLGVPVIESIDEILTDVTRRRRLSRNLVAVPAAALAAFAMLITTGTMAYLSLERPTEYQQLRSTPAKVVRSFLG
jgi:hypothetical protein